MNVASRRQTVIPVEQSSRSSSAPTRRGVFLLWLRRIHSWIGLWGALLGLLFGITGILHNHRSVLKLPLEQPSVSSVQLTLPDPKPQSPQEFARWLQAELGLKHEPDRVLREKSERVVWGDRSVVQPERWQVRFTAPQATVQADYWLGSSQASVKRTEQTLVGTLNNFHRGTGANVGWVLLADSIAGSLILLSITGVILWTKLNRRRSVGAAIVFSSFLALIAIAMQTL